jgi:hypothetical protein
MIAAATAEHRVVSKLLDEGTLTSVGLASMRRESEVMGLPLVEVLLTHDLISEADVGQIYADMNGLRFLDLSRRTPERAWVLTVPENIARRKDCLLFGEVSGQLGEAFLAQDLMDQDVAQDAVFNAEDLLDVVDGVVLLAKFDDPFAGRLAFGSFLGPGF